VPSAKVVAHRQFWPLYHAGDHGFDGVSLVVWYPFDGSFSCNLYALNAFREEITLASTMAACPASLAGAWAEDLAMFEGTPVSVALNETFIPVDIAEAAQ